MEGRTEAVINGGDGEAGGGLRACVAKKRIASVQTFTLKSSFSPNGFVWLSTVFGFFLKIMPPFHTPCTFACIYIIM